MYKHGSRTAEEDPEVLAMIQSRSRELGLARREISADEVRCCLLCVELHDALVLFLLFLSLSLYLSLSRSLLLFFFTTTFPFLSSVRLWNGASCR